MTHDPEQFPKEYEKAPGTPEQGVVVELASGEWRGDFTDVRGLRGSLRLDLKSDGQDVTGRYALELRGRDAPIRYEGRLTGSADGAGGVRLRVLVGKPDAKDAAQGEVLEYEAKLGSGGSYADQVMYGVVRTSPESGTGGGVWIAWHFTDEGSR